MARRTSFADIVNGGEDFAPSPPERPASRSGEPQSGGSPSGDLGVLVFAGETWSVIVSEARQCGMTPEAMVSRAIAEFVDRRHRPAQSGAQSTARAIPKVEKIR